MNVEFLLGLLTGLCIAMFSLLIFKWASSLQKKMLAENFKEREVLMEERLIDYINNNDIYRKKRRLK